MSVSYPWLGMVVPVWYPVDAEPELAHSLLEDTLSGVEHFCRPEHLVLVLDGQAVWQEMVQKAAANRGAHYVYLPTNLGKGAAVAAGINVLRDADLRFIVTRDSDGDHMIGDMPALLTLAEQMEEETGNAFLIVSGGRQDRVRPLGFERAEYEEVTDRVLWQALQYHAAQQGRVLSSAYFASYGDWPDIQSGYKVYSVEAARIAATVLAEACEGTPDGGLARCGVETMPAVEILAASGVIGVIARRTYQVQPVSGYRGVEGCKMYGEPLLWAFRRLEIPGEVACVMLDDALLRSRLLFDALRRAKALEIRSFVLAGLGIDRPPRMGSRFC